jgi:hypothetical protein
MSALGRCTPDRHCQVLGRLHRSVTPAIDDRLIQDVIVGCMCEQASAIDQIFRQNGVED